MSDECREELEAFKIDRAQNVNKDLPLAKVQWVGGEQAAGRCAACCTPELAPLQLFASGGFAAAPPI